MSDASMIIAKKFDELIKRQRVETFSSVERMIWFLLTIRCEKDMNGFASIFEQAVEYGELKESIRYMSQVGLHYPALLFQQAFDLLKEANVYGGHSRPIIPISIELHQELEEISDEVGDSLWQIDEKLLALLQAEEAAK